MWLTTLIEQVKLHGQRPVAEKLGVSTAVISQVCNQKYPGDMARIQALVESVYLAKTVNCPVLGEIAWHTCQQNQKNEHTSNPQKLRIYRACRSGCPSSNLPVTQNIQIQPQVNRGYRHNHYDAEAVISRLKRQAETDGKAHQLAELLQSELINLAARYNRLNKANKP